MQKTLIYINAETKAQIDPSGTPIKKTSDMPTIERGQWQILCFQFMDVITDDVGAVSLENHKFTSATFVLVADNDFSDDNSLMLKSYSSVIPFNESDPTSNRMNIEGDWIDGKTADITKGQISFRVNADTLKFTECLGSKVSVTNGTYISIKQYETDVSTPSSIVWTKFVATNTIRDWKSDVTEQPPEGTVLVPFVDSYLKRPFEFQFSTDGSEWHDLQTLDDIYYRQRISGIDTEWSIPLRIMKYASSDVAVSNLVDDLITIKNMGTPPVAVKTSYGNLYPIEKGTVSMTDAYITIDPKPYMAYDNVAEFTGVWYVYFTGSESNRVQDARGLEISERDSTSIIFRNNTVVKYEIAEGDSFTFDTSELSADFCATMELWLSMKDSVKSFSFPADIVWVDGVTPKFDTANREYVIVLRWDGTRLIANLAYSVEVN